MIAYEYIHSRYREHRRLHSFCLRWIHPAAPFLKLMHLLSQHAALALLLVLSSAQSSLHGLRCELLRLQPGEAPAGCRYCNEARAGRVLYRGTFGTQLPGGWTANALDVGVRRVPHIPHTFICCPLLRCSTMLTACQ